MPACGQAVGCGVCDTTRWSSGAAPRACVRVYARVLVPPNLYIHTYIRLDFMAAVLPNSETFSNQPNQVLKLGRRLADAAMRNSPALDTFLTSGGTILEGKGIMYMYARDAESAIQHSVRPALP